VRTFRLQTASQQIAAYLREEIRSGRAQGKMPGRAELAKRLGVGVSSAELALRQLEREGLLVGGGEGRMRRIAEGQATVAPQRTRLAVLTYEPVSASAAYYSELIRLLWDAGHEAFFSSRSQLELGMNLKRIARHVRETQADAWIVCSAPREVAEWFAARKTPAFLLFGRRKELGISSVGPEKSDAFVEAARRLIGLGHRRIVLLVRERRRKPGPGTPERAFLAALEEAGITPSAFNLPDWVEGADGFQARLEALFQVTPPTALLVDGLQMLLATQQFLNQRRLRVPDDVSLICLESHPSFAWCRPSIAHVHWDQRPVLMRAVQWADHVTQGQTDRVPSSTGATFIDGGSVGPVPAGQW
jgi:DNA-binding LacI/PurR family transcriptional regulator